MPVLLPVPRLPLVPLTHLLPSLLLPLPPLLLSLPTPAAAAAATATAAAAAATSADDSSYSSSSANDGHGDNSSSSSSSGKPLGMLGLGWGSYVGLRAAGDEDFVDEGLVAVACMSPTTFMFDSELSQDLRVPVALLPAKYDTMDQVSRQLSQL